MKNIFVFFACIFTLLACEQTDVRHQAANVMYNRCIESGEDRQWCRCLRADLIDSKNQFTEQMANYIVQGYQHPWLSMAITGARLRCECRINPMRMAARGLPCNGIKQLKY